MRDMRPVIVGMNNPLSVDPRAALLPYPKHSSGWNLWSMVHDVCGVSRGEFRRSFCFVNLCDDTVWDPLAARRKYDTLESAWEGRRVVLLGLAVLGVLWQTRPSSALEWRSNAGYRWCWVPNPNRLCEDYSNPLIRRVVGMRLEELMSC